MAWSFEHDYYFSEGKAEGKSEVLYALVAGGDITPEKAARQLGVSTEEFIQDMQNAEAAALTKAGG